MQTSIRRFLPNSIKPSVELRAMARLRIEFDIGDRSQHPRSH